MQRLKITNATVVGLYKIIPNATILVAEGKIQAISTEDVTFSDSIEIDAKGHYVMAGFIDIHIHGGGGHDFMDGTVDAFTNIATIHAQYGTTAMVATTLTSEYEHLIHTLNCYEKALEQNTAGAQFLGMHLEGPYFAMNQRGAQDPRFIRKPNPNEYKPIVEKYGHLIARWSIAPEQEGALAMGDYLHEHQILASVAHTEALYDEVVNAFEHHYTLMTHLYSAMLGVTRHNAFRHAGAVEAAFLIDEMDVEIIADGIHLPPPLLKLVYKIKGTDHIALITDAMRAAGTNDTESILGSKENGLSVIVEDGVAKLPDRTAFAGSIATTDRLLRTVVNQADIPLVDAVRTLTYTPARIMKVAHKKGSIAVGKDADLVILDDSLQVKCTIVAGKIVYSKMNNVIK